VTLEQALELPPREFARLFGDGAGELEFERVELRHTRNRRALTCGHTIPPRDSYRYSVAKLRGIPGLVQTALCDCCMRVCEGVSFRPSS
jgi:hypothetical protein